VKESQGRLVLVVGPSGAGKDSVIRYAKEKLAGNPRFVFPRRIITRTADPAHEDHDTVDAQCFDTLVQKDAFALWWTAHGLKYGVSKSVETELKHRKTAVLNVSRSIVADAAERYANTLIAEIWATPAILAERLAARARKGEDIAQRVERATKTLPPAIKAYRIVNEASLENAGEEFCGLLLEDRL
jgi:ribose 1,5-bisphosphokinase